VFEWIKMGDFFEFLDEPGVFQVAFAFFPFLEHAGDATRLVGPTSRF
jgi:hypothetical protein